VPVVDAERMWRRPGGAGLAAVLAARDSDVVLVTALADDADGQALALLASAGVTVVAMPMAGSTVCKTRIRAGGQSMLRLDHGDGSAATEPVPPRVAAAIDDAAAVCVSDYGHGVTAHPVSAICWPEPPSGYRWCGTRIPKGPGRHPAAGW
jgi:D-beta-D-heptose 7-phosphate kinase / D-beta-D-heptose 1-phosphate adenosyltransferase